MKIQENFQIRMQKLQLLFPGMIQEIKKNVKAELFRKYPKVYQKHFSRMHFSKCSFVELATPLLQEVLEGNENLAEWIVALWIAKNQEIYHFFAQRLMKINPEFDKIESIEDPYGRAVMKEAVGSYGAQKTYIFCVLNNVAFSEIIFQELENLVKELGDEKGAAP